MQILERKDGVAARLLEDMDREMYDILSAYGAKIPYEYFSKRDLDKQYFLSYKAYHCLCIDDSAICVCNIVQTPKTIGARDLVGIPDNKYPCAFIWKLYVRPECRCQGLAKALVQHVKRVQTKLNPQGITALHVSNANPHAKNIYLNWGFTKLHDTHDDYGITGEILYL